VYPFLFIVNYHRPRPLQEYFHRGNGNNKICSQIYFSSHFNIFTDRPILALYNILSRFICVCLQTGYGLVNRFIDHLYTPLGTTSNYSATANLRTLQITASNIKIFQARTLFNSCFLVTDVNSGDSSASHIQVLPVRPISRN
jgi:hypothetical protein